MEKKEVQKEKNVRLRLTPLNIVSAVFLVIAIYLLLEKKQPRGTAMYINLSGMLVGFSFLIAIVCFISDQIFRKFVPELKKIWILECFFVAITLLLIFIIKISIY